MSILSLLILLIILGVVFWAARSLMAAFGLPEPLQTVVIVLLVLVGLVLILQGFGVATGLPALRLT